MQLQTSIRYTFIFAMHNLYQKYIEYKIRVHQATLPSSLSVFDSWEFLTYENYNYLNTHPSSATATSALPTAQLEFSFDFKDPSRNKSLGISTFPAGNYMPKVNDRNFRRCETCPKLTIKTRTTPLKSIVLLSLLLTLNMFHTFFNCFYCSLWVSRHYAITMKTDFTKRLLIIFFTRLYKLEILSLQYSQNDITNSFS